MAVLRNIVRVYTPTVGAGALTLGAAVQGYKTFAQAGCANGEVLTYGIHDFNGAGNLIASEVGRGTYNAVLGTLARTTVLASTNGDALLNLTGNAHVFITAIAEDFDHTVSILNVGVNTHAQIDLHLASVANPHATTAAQVGAPALVNPSVVGNFVSFSGVTGAQQDSGVSAASFQGANATLASILALANAAGWLHNDGAGVLSWSTPPVGVGGSGVVGQVAEWVADTHTLGAAKLIAPTGAILTLVNASAKSIIFPGSANDTVSLLGEANVYTTTQTITPATDVVGLVINKSSTANALQVKNGATVIAAIDKSGRWIGDLGLGSYNFFIGDGAGSPTASGAYNFGAGAGALKAITSAWYSLGIGTNSLSTLRTGYYNSAIGVNAMAHCASDTTQNTVIGYGSGDKLASVNNTVIGTFAVPVLVDTSATNGDNLALGAFVGYLLTSGSRNILLGAFAGYRQTTVSDLLLIDSRQRASAAEELKNAIIVGTMGATPGAQTLRMNAVTTVAVDTTTTNAPLVVEDFRSYVSTAGMGFANGGGVAYTLTGETATDGTLQLMAQVAAVWVDSTNATRKAKLQLSAYDTAIRTGLEIEATGSAAILTAYGTVHRSTSDMRRYYHVSLGSANPGGSGASFVDASANTTGGWRLTNASWLLRGQADIHSDWDAASDLKFGVNFMVNIDNTGGADTDTVDLRASIYYKGLGDTATKTQAVEVATVVGKSAQYKQFRADFTIDWDAVSNVVEVGDIIAIVLNLETDTSEVDDIVVTSMEFYYNTTHIGIESTDV